MRTSGLVLWSAACFFAVAQLSAQSAEERVEELPSYAKPLMWSDPSNSSTPHVFVLPEGTQIPLEFVTPVSTRTAKRSDRVRFQVVSDVRVAGLTATRKGAEAWGIVTVAKKPVCKQCERWDWHSTDSLQAPLLTLFAPVTLAMMPEEDRLAVLGSAFEGIISKCDHAKRLVGARMEAVTSHAIELNREEFSKSASEPGP